MHANSWLGSGITIASEVEIEIGLILRPISIERDIEKLAKRAESQRQYGLLCAISETVTYEMESTGKTPDEAAVNCWNNQYALILLSMISRTFIFNFIQVPGNYTASVEQKLLVSSSVGLFRFDSKPKEVSRDEITTLIRLLPNFRKLLRTNRFSFASAIAGTVYIHPNQVVQIAAISLPPSLVEFRRTRSLNLSMTEMHFHSSFAGAVIEYSPAPEGNGAPDSRSKFGPVHKP
jgi:hypothetical protein